MKLYSSLPYKFVPLDGTLDPAAPTLTFIVKATFILKNDGLAVAAPAEEQAEFAGDEPYMDEIGRSLRYATDLVPFKPFGEVLLTANCHAPNGAPAASVEVGLHAGPIDKRLRVFGDRVWLRDGHGGFKVEGPVPFKEMPLRWERAFGGLDFARNPMGRGLEPWTDKDGHKLFYLANIEALDHPTVDPDHLAPSHEHMVPPQCFAPVSPQWQPRFGREGTRDRHWATFVAPLPPRDHDPRAAQAAPQDQWLDRYWTGDEPIVLTHMHPQHPKYSTGLPGSRLRLFVEGYLDGGPTLEFGEVPLDLDTVHIDMTTERMHLTWRRRFRPHRPGAQELRSAYLVEEPLESEPAPLDEHYENFLGLKGPEQEPKVVQLKRDEEAALAQARNTLVDAKVDPAIIARFDAAPDTPARFAMMMELMKSKTAELEALIAPVKGV